MFKYPSRALRAAGLVLAATTALAGTAQASQIKVTVTNNSEAGGLYLTPFLSIFHDGTFDTFNQGAAASAGVEAIAEDGNVVPERARADSSSSVIHTDVVTGPAGFGAGAGQPPLLDPGEVSSITVTLSDTTDVYFSFLSMLLPTNDNFLGNDNPMAYELFDSAGNFTGLPDIQVLGGDVWDAGTEDNTGFGLPFSTAGGTATDTQNGVIRPQGNLNFLLGRGTPAGDILSVQGNRDLLATISFEQVAAVPLPAALPMLLVGLGALGVTSRRRKQS